MIPLCRLEACPGFDPGTHLLRPQLREQRGLPIGHVETKPLLILRRDVAIALAEIGP